MKRALFPDCGCPPDSHGSITLTNLVCRNPECRDYGTHRRGVKGDHCNFCGDLFVPLAADPFKGAR
jgi:hypothetical protein